MKNAGNDSIVPLDVSKLESPGNSNGGSANAASRPLSSKSVNVVRVYDSGNIHRSEFQNNNDVSHNLEKLTVKNEAIRSEDNKKKKASDQTSLENVDDFPTNDGLNNFDVKRTALYSILGVCGIFFGMWSTSFYLLLPQKNVFKEPEYWYQPIIPQAIIWIPFMACHFFARVYYCIDFKWESP